MSTKNKKNETPEMQVVENVQLVKTESGAIVNANDGEEISTEGMLAILAKARESEELVHEYIEISPEDDFRAFFTGTVRIKGKEGFPTDSEDGRVTAVKLLTDEGNQVITAATVLVGALQDLPVPTMVRIICTGEEKSSKGKYLTFRVIRLS